jgi:hypothetical protein
MSFFPQLDGKALPDLATLFQSAPGAGGVDPGESDLFLQEVAVRIAGAGGQGAAFLLDALKDAEPERVRAIVVSLGFVQTESAEQAKSALLPFLASPDPGLIAKAVDALNQLACADLKEAVAPLLNHGSPYVVGSALRFYGRHYPSETKGLLLKALTSSEPIVRQNAIDELDELECTEALPSIAGLVNDPDRSVREAAQWAVEHLEEAKGKPKPHRAIAG